MNWPDTVTICGFEYEVEYVDGRIQNVGEDGEFYGEINYNTHKIRVQDNRPAFDVFEILMHEIFHGIDNHAATRLFGDDEGEVKLRAFCKMFCDTLVRSGIIEVE